MSKRKKKTAYDDSLPRIFLWSGFDMFMILLITCVLIGGLLFVYRRSDPEAAKLMTWCLAMVVPCSYALPLVSLLKVRRQERILGISWKDRRDHNRAAWERDWYLTYERGGFILCHRAYIQRILNVRVVEETTDLGRERVHCVIFEDIRGKKHILRFSSSSMQRTFLQWYEKRAYTQENEDLRCTL